MKLEKETSPACDMFPEDVFYSGLKPHYLKWWAIQRELPYIKKQLLNLLQNIDHTQNSDCHFPNEHISISIIWHRQEIGIAQRYWFDWSFSNGVDHYTVHCYPVSNLDDKFVFGRSITCVLYHAVLLHKYYNTIGPNTQITVPAITWNDLDALSDEIPLEEEFVSRYDFVDWHKSIYKSLGLTFPPDGFACVCHDRNGLGTLLRFVALTGAWFTWLTDKHNLLEVQKNPARHGNLLSNDEYDYFIFLRNDFFVQNYVMTNEEENYDTSFSGDVLFGWS